MKILLKFPTRNRPHKFLSVLKKYLKKASNPKNISILVSCDSDDESMKSDVVKKVLDTYENLEIHFSDNKNKIEAVNADMDKTDLDYDIILLASDDMIPVVQGWDDIIIKDMQDNFEDTDGVLWYFDGFKKDLNTLCILGKKYYERFSYIYHPSYKSFYCDNEFTEVADFLGKQKFIEQTIIHHQNPVWGFGGADELFIKNMKYEDEDKLNYQKRKSINFEI